MEKYIKMNRLEYIDAAKAIGIVLMIIGHCHIAYIVPYAFNAIYQFHMPLFLIISGLFYKPLKVKDCLMHYSRSYLWPYIVGCVFTILAVFVLCLFTNYVMYDEIRRCLVASFYANGMFSSRENVIMGDIPGIGVCWYLWGLFFALLIYNVLTHYFSKHLITIISVCLFLLGSKIGNFILLPFSISSGLSSIIYIHIGFLMKNVLKSITIQTVKNNNIYEELVFLFMVIILYCYATCRGTIIIAASRFDEGILSVIISTLIVFMLLILCKLANFRGWIGRYTLEIIGVR